MREPLNQSLDAGQPASGGDTIIDAAAPSIQGAAAAAQHSTPGRAPGMRRRMSSSSLADDAADAVDAADGKPAGPEFDEMMVANKQGLGALTGVFVPCMLSIIGVVLFMRLGWAIGEAGVVGVLSMFGFGACLILLTDLSLCALATNGKIRGGGTYYLISRSLGPVFGGAIGVMFFFANAVGIAFYMQGFSDTMGSILGIDPGPDGKLPKLGMAFACLAVETVIAIVGSGLYSKCALIIFFIQMASIFAGTASALTRGGEPFTWTGLDQMDNNCTFQYLGPSMATLRSNLYPKYSPDSSFKSVFKVIFPALTGIMAGANMSGVLKRPELSIPRGELSAIFCSMSTYVIVVLALGSSVPRETLQGDYYVLSKVTWYPVLVTIGIIASTVSSALASIQSASRVIQAIAQDDLIPLLRPLKWECNGEPVAAILLSVTIGMALLCVGSLDYIAPILTMFFLLTYATTNAACFVHRVSGHPNFRPRFRFFSWPSAFLGGGLCFATMFYLQWLYSTVTIVAMIALAAYISHRAALSGDLAGGQTWGDVGQSILFHQVRKYLLQLERADLTHVKYWRPQFMVVLHGGPSGNVPMLEFINNMKKGGLFIIGDLVTIAAGTDPDDETFAQCANRRELWHHFLEEAQFKAFIEVGLEQAGSPRLGVANLVMSTGIGGLKPNTLVLLFPDGSDSSPRYPDLTEVVERYRRVAGAADDAQRQADAFAALGQQSLALRELTSNSIYEPRAENGCRVTSAYQRELWSPRAPPNSAWRLPGVQFSPSPAKAVSPRTPAGGVDESAEVEDASAERMTPGEYVGILQDTISSQKHLILLRSMAELDKHAIAKRLGKFSKAAQDARAASLSLEEQRKRIERRETLNPWVKAEPVRIDIWVMPWTNRADLMMQLQLSYMLSRDDFWTKQAYLRVCSVVGDFTQIGYGEGEGGQRPVTTKAQRHKELHDEVWRKMRIPAAIEVFNAQETAPQAWRSCCEDLQQQHASSTANGAHSAAPGPPATEAVEDGDEDDQVLDARMSSLLNAVILSRECPSHPLAPSRRPETRVACWYRELHDGGVDCIDARHARARQSRLACCARPSGGALLGLARGADGRPRANHAGQGTGGLRRDYNGAMIAFLHPARRCLSAL